MYTYIYIVREYKIVLMSLSKGTTRTSKGKENVIEWKNIEETHLHMNILYLL
jgi:hypothetical protein